MAEGIVGLPLQPHSSLTLRALETGKAGGGTSLHPVLCVGNS